MGLRSRRFIVRNERLITFTLFVFGVVWVALYPFIINYPAADFIKFMAAGRGESLEGIFYAPWIFPYYTLLSKFQFPFAHALSNVVSFAGFWFALNTFKGNKLLFVVSYPLFVAMGYGQMDGIYAFGLAWMYRTLPRGGYLAASLGLLLAVIKPYVGIPLGMGLLYLYADNRTRLRVIALMGLYTLLSFVLWGDWLMPLIDRIRNAPPFDYYTIDLWSYLGPVVLLLWIPVLLSRKKDYRWWVATWTLTIPYLHIHGLTYMLLFPVGIIGWLVQAGYRGLDVLAARPLEVIPLLLAPPIYVYVISLWEVLNVTHLFARPDVVKEVT